MVATVVPEGIDHGIESERRIDAHRVEPERAELRAATAIAMILGT